MVNSSIFYTHFLHSDALLKYMILNVNEQSPLKMLKQNKFLLFKGIFHSIQDLKKKRLMDFSKCSESYSLQNLEGK